jgi:prevent-host-death family protein
MTEMTIHKPSTKLAELLDRASRGERIIIRRRGKKAAVLVPIADIKLIEKIEDKIDRELAKKARKEKGGILWTDLKIKLGL